MIDLLERSHKPQAISHWRPTQRQYPTGTATAVAAGSKYNGAVVCVCVVELTAG
jgi:hypothetical protein